MNWAPKWYARLETFGSSYRFDGLPVNQRVVVSKLIRGAKHLHAELCAPLVDGATAWTRWNWPNVAGMRPLREARQCHRRLVDRAASDFY